VQPGQTLWSIAADVSHGGDVRDTMAQLERLNHLDSAGLQVGQTLRVPT
jgi:LysM repeat protein